MEATIEETSAYMLQQDVYFIKCILVCEKNNLHY